MTQSLLWSTKLAAGAILLSALIAAAPAGAQAPVYAGGESVFVGYADGDGADRRAPTINLGFVGHRDGEISARFIMDTGSVGIIATPDHFRPGRDARNLGPGQQTYSSSGIVENGNWWLAGVNIYDAGGSLMARAEVPVLLVDSITCLPDARDCRPRDRPRGVAMMGVGFARESGQQVHGTPDFNPFLTVTHVAGAKGRLHPLRGDWHSGYVVTARGVYLGLTGAVTGNAAFAKLAPNPAYSTPAHREWMATPMTITVNGASAAGHLLMDTGVNTAYLSPPSGAPLGALGGCQEARSDRCAPPGTKVTVAVPNAVNPVASYSFIVGEDGNPMQPGDVVVVHDPAPFLNTSRHFLSGMNFIYDAAGGYVGFQWTGGAGAGNGFVRP